ncbi:hypothetical protein GOP47_0002922 [Adiantum capillus-veneris]|uniref:Uncharacterized protein n=1 Tax=Adiantum capillus-veneris TaxID=13818 RepID=A0A9D4VBT0_ADICA|nr:hypothetical protein GOP47_0002922 [Adiantum capillus-veneris]
MENVNAQTVELQSLKRLTFKSLKRSFDLFASCHAQRTPADPNCIRSRTACKIQDEYRAVKDSAAFCENDEADVASPSTEGAPPLALPSFAHEGTYTQPDNKVAESALAIVTSNPASGEIKVQGADSIAAMRPVITPLSDYKPPESCQTESASILRRLRPSKWPRPVWHRPWENYRVISGHLGPVSSIAFSPGNDWFCTGSWDRTIKIWDRASGQLKLTLTGHIGKVRGLAVSSRSPYLFSAGDDKQVKCWDLERNEVIRSYHGHSSGVYCLSLHPRLEILFSGGGDSVCRVWDIRTRAQVHALSGHDGSVCSIATQAAMDPQVITGSLDTTIKLWDLAAGKSMSTLTFHKKSVRALAMHPFEYSFASASADNIKKFTLPKGGDNGSIWFWDWKSGHNFQKTQTKVQPGSLGCEAGIYALSYDVTGTRLVTCEADKTIKMWKEDEDATPETHPLKFKPPKDMRRF